MSGNRGGFTLLEVLVALSVFLIGIVAVLGLMTAGTHLQQESDRIAAVADAVDEATLRAMRDLETLKLADDGVPSAPSEWTALERHRGMETRYSVQRTLDGDRLRLEVELRWLEGGRQRTHSSVRLLPHTRSMAQEVARRIDQR